MKIDKSKKRYTILIVDDIPKNVELAANILQAENYNITFTTSGEAALKKVNEIDFDLILLDVMMPGMDGFEVCRILKSDPKFKEIPIIFLTAKSETENIVLGFELGAVDYVTKPFSAEELLARVKNHLSIREKILEKDNLEKQLSDDTSTSANISGEPSAIRFQQISEKVKSQVDYVVKLYQNEIRLMRPSRIIRITETGDFEIVRE
jgi:DNA-binding response OmpR family regulator